MNNEQSQNINFNIFLILWAAILWSCCIFTGLVYFNFKGPIFSTQDFINAAPFSFILLGVSVITFISAGALFKILIKPHRLGQNMPEQEMHQKYFVPFIVKIVMYEACSIMGLALSFTESKSLILPFFILSTVGFLTSFPTKDKIKATFLRR